MKFLLFSVVIHATLIAILFLLPNRNKQPQIVNVEIRTEESQMTLKLVHGSHLQGQGSHSLNHHMGSGKYFPQYRFKSSAINSGGDTYATNPLHDDSRAEWGSGSESFARVAETNLMQVIYERVDYNLSYPGILARNKITGTVNARIVLVENGGCDWHKILIHGHQPYLELYVMDVLKRVCQQNYKSYLGARQITNVDMSFKFDINENNDFERVKSEKFIVGNTLLFYRNSHQSAMEWELGPFKGMFPVPMIYLNLPWIQENWERLIHQKDPLSEFKKEFGES